MINEPYVGITENGDASCDYSWLNKVDRSIFSIIISKRLTPELIKNLIEKKEKVIFHLTCTGWGKSAMEPNAYTVDENYIAFTNLVEKGFPIEQIVLRVDPIIPTNHGLKIAEQVLEKFSLSGIKRLRYSFIDNFPRIKKQLAQINMSLPWESFNAPKQNIKKFYKLQTKYPMFEYESCAEINADQLGCISTKDFYIFGIEPPQLINAHMRPGCLCCTLKTELLDSSLLCPIGCRYCYRNSKLLE